MNTEYPTENPSCEFYPVNDSNRLFESLELQKLKIQKTNFSNSRSVPLGDRLPSLSKRIRRFFGKPVHLPTPVDHFPVLLETSCPRTTLYIKSITTECDKCDECEHQEVHTIQQILRESLVVPSKSCSTCSRRQAITSECLWMRNEINFFFFHLCGRPPPAVNWKFKSHNCEMISLKSKQFALYLFVEPNRRSHTDWHWKAPRCFPWETADQLGPTRKLL